MAQQPTHWRDRAIGASEAISDGFEVLKAYGARVAEWILFFCLIANILEIFPLPEPFASIMGNIVLGIQSVTLDIAGFGLASMGDHARRRGDLAAARKAGGMGWTLIGVMILTVSLVTLGVLVPVTKPYVDITEKVLILVRVVVTVLYGHIVHSLRNAGADFDNRVQTLESELSTVQTQLQARQQEVSSARGQVTRVQNQLSTVQEELDRAKQEVSSGQRRLEAEQQRASSLEEELLTGQGETGQVRRELAAVRLDAESLQTRLEAKMREVEAMQADLSSVVALRRDLTTAHLEASALREQLDKQTQALEAVQMHLSTERRTVSSAPSQVSRRPGVQVSTGQQNRETGQAQHVSTGQQKVVDLDSRRKSGQDDAVEAKIRDYHANVARVQSVSARTIATSVGCSPTTAAKWKAAIEEEERRAANQ